MAFFVDKDSVVRKIWGKADTILFIFAGAAAEFALNKAVDWLYFTGKLPADPLGRLFTTVAYARKIIFSEEAEALKAIDTMQKIHGAVEAERGIKIPDWAYRDVLFMLIHYSIASFELLERKMTEKEDRELFDVFQRVGERMGIPGLPASFPEWKTMRQEHLHHDLRKSNFTTDLFLQYKKHLGWVRYRILIESQKLVVPPIVSNLLGFGKTSFLKPVLMAYKFSRSIKLDWLIKAIILPSEYKIQIKNLDYQPNH